MKREIITIDEDLCNGCGLCVPNCHEGALQMIDGKARLISDLMCDGLGACIGHCPEGAITIEEREAEPYDEIKVMSHMVTKGKNTIIAHLGHLKEHGEKDFLRQGVKYLLENQDKLDYNADEVLEAVHGMPLGKAAHAKEEQQHHAHHGHHDHAPKHEEGAGACGCAGSKTQTFIPVAAVENVSGRNLTSALSHWPVQMHLINPRAGHFQGSHLLLAADCTAFSLGSFHPGYLQGKTLAIACPKLDSNREVYIEKLRILIDESKIDMLTVMIMEVPCCSGLLQMAEQALSQASRQVPVKLVVVSVDGQIKVEKWHRVA
ncbi:MAG: 4Fe-4S binding protein [Bacteroidales bacterium]|jgi:NAD-dependent dihydropyrimidine dehydrogenase PreA subunit